MNRRLLLAATVIAALGAEHFGRTAASNAPNPEPLPPRRRDPEPMPEDSPVAIAARIKRAERARKKITTGHWGKP